MIRSPVILPVHTVFSSQILVHFNYSTKCSITAIICIETWKRTTTKESWSLKQLINRLLHGYDLKCIVSFDKPLAPELLHVTNLPTFLLKESTVDHYCKEFKGMCLTFCFKLSTQTTASCCFAVWFFFLYLTWK